MKMKWRAFSFSNPGRVMTDYVDSARCLKFRSINAKNSFKKTQVTHKLLSWGTKQIQFTKICFFFPNTKRWTLFNTVSRVRCFYFHDATAPSGSRTLHDRDFTIALRRTNASWRVISPTQRPLLDNTQCLKETGIHATGGIRTHNPSKKKKRP